MLWCHLHQSIFLRVKYFYWQILWVVGGIKQNCFSVSLAALPCCQYFHILSYLYQYFKELLLPKSFEYQKPLLSVDLKDACKTFVVSFSQWKQLLLLLLWVVGGFRLCHVGKRKQKTLNLTFTVIWLFLVIKHPGIFLCSLIRTLTHCWQFGGSVSCSRTLWHADWKPPKFWWMTSPTKLFTPTSFT